MAGSGLAAREAALKVLLAVETRGAYAGLALEAEARPLKGPDRGLATELVHGVLRHRALLDFTLGTRLQRPLASLPVPIRNVLRLGLYQLMSLDRVPAAAACNTSVELAKAYGHPGTAALVNAVLRGLAKVREAGDPWPAPPKDPFPVYLSITESHPLWLIERWLGRLGTEQARRLAQANNQAPPVTIRTNLLRTSRDELAGRLEAEGVSVMPGRHAPEALHMTGSPALEELEAFQQGLFSVQDEASMLVARVVAPEPGELVIDACAAPGGKTTHLAELMGDTGQVLAGDIHRHRLKLVGTAASRLGLKSVKLAAGNASRLGDKYKLRADRLLLDAPCSGLGVLRRRSDLRWRQSPQAIGQLAALQRSLLEGSCGTVKPGGVLVYATCSTEPEENEAVVAEFLTAHPEFAPDDIAPFVPASLAGACVGGSLRTWPHDHGTDGFFIARLRRRT